MISVILHGYRNKVYFEQAVVTLAQQEEEWEAIVVDDGSFLQGVSLPGEVEKRFSFITTKRPVGLLRSFAIGSSLARGDYFVLQRGCDCHVSDRFKHQVSLLAATQADAVLAWPKILTDEGLDHNLNQQASCFVDKSTLLQAMQRNCVLYRLSLCISAFMFRVNAFDLERLHRSLRSIKKKPTTVATANILYSCLPSSYYSTNFTSAIVNNKSDVALFEADNSREIIALPPEE